MPWLNRHQHHRDIGRSSILQGQHPINKSLVRNPFSLFDLEMLPSNEARWSHSIQENSKFSTIFKKGPQEERSKKSRRLGKRGMTFHGIRFVPLEKFNPRQFGAFSTKEDPIQGTRPILSTPNTPERCSLDRKPQGRAVLGKNQSQPARLKTLHI